MTAVLLLGLLLLLLLLQSVNAAVDILDYVDPLIGSNNGGNTFVGANLPYGMAKPVADVDGQNTGGFATDNSNVNGFSSMHDSGTGGNPSLGTFPLFPQYCEEDNDINSCSFRKEDRAEKYVNESVVSRPGYFAVTLEGSGIEAEMTATEHAALYRFVFPRLYKNDGEEDKEEGDLLHPLIMLDLTDIYDTRQNATIEIDPHTGRMQGNGTFLPSFGAGTFQSYFCVDFEHPAHVYDSGIYVNHRAGTEVQSIFVTRGFNTFYLQAGGFVRFPYNDSEEGGRITARVGVSLVSTRQACRNAEREIPDYDFEGIRKRAEDAWREKLAPFKVEMGGGVDQEDFLTSFYSGIYRTMMSPQDYTGENPLWVSDEPHFDSFYW